MTLDEVEVRRGKLASLIEAGTAAYPSRCERSAMIRAALENFDKWSKAEKTVILAGRIMTTRVHGNLLFADLRDSDAKIQLVLKHDEVGEALFAMFRDRMDPGDFVQAQGALFTTKTGEKSLKVKAWKVLAKALLPLPEKFHGLADIELRYRHRELDLIANAEVRDVFRKRTLVIRALREALDREGFDEVETPMLQTVPGGATARPFKTHHNALNMELYLRIAPELYLKRLIIGGYEKVYEIGRQFRNEGIDWAHNPEFTSLEFYWAYQDYRGLMDFTERLLLEVIENVNSGPVVNFRGEHIDFSGPWSRKTFRDAVREAADIDIAETEQKELITRMKKLKIECDYGKAGLGKLYDELYKETVRQPQIQPILVTDYPIEMEPLAKKCDDNPRFVQRFQLIAGGLELLKAYSELNDPEDQLERFNAQQALREAGDEEAQHIDHAFMQALKHGLPPTAGWGMGIDRFVMMLADAPSIKDVILFPTLRPENFGSGLSSN